jgi:hypothetical protein
MRETPVQGTTSAADCRNLNKISLKNMNYIEDTNNDPIKVLSVALFAAV